MTVGLLTLKIHLPGCASLKEKRGRLKPLLSRLHKEFNISVAEIEHQDAWQTAGIACALVSNDYLHTNQALQMVISWIEMYWPDVQIEDEHLEFY